MSEDEYFKYIYSQITQLSEREKEKLEDFLGDMEQSWVRDEQTIKAYKKYIKNITVKIKYYL